MIATWLSAPSKLLQAPCLKQRLLTYSVKSFSTKLKVDIKKDNIQYSDIHGWLYAYNQKTAAPNCYWDKDLRLGICGDWFSGANAECAFVNAKHLASIIWLTEVILIYGF